VKSKSSPGNFFEDFVIGETLHHAVPRTVTEGDAALYIALTGDRFPLYCSREFARSLGYEREVVNDLLVFHIVFGKSVPDISQNAVANLGYAGVQFPAPVYTGDTLTAISEIVGKKENSNGKTGNVYVFTLGTNQHGDVVCAFFRWVMVRKRDPETRTGENEIPDLPTEVGRDLLVLEETLETSVWDDGATGGASYFADYAKGERILHGAGMCIEEAEHAMATRLYQNTARVHFDAHAMERRLIYGGHIISVARALSFNGLENAARMLAWNSGTHANPTYAGDTIYAMTEVLDSAPLGSTETYGALRLRLVAFKNFDPASEEFDVMTAASDGGRARYHGNVVLDLDYWVAMPKRPEGLSE